MDIDEMWYMACRQRDTARTASAAWKAECKAQKKRVAELEEEVAELVGIIKYTNDNIASPSRHNIIEHRTWVALNKDKEV